jgi:hypothetical protein
MQAETKQIMKKRTAFETALVRRVAKKTDFVRYAAYEMGLEQLRRKRVERLRESIKQSNFDSKSTMAPRRITSLAAIHIGLCSRPQTVPYL